MAPTLCGNLVRSKRTLLAAGWSVVNLLVFSSYAAMFVFSFLSAKYVNNHNQQQQYNYYGEEEEHREEDIEISVTSRAMAFTSLWTVIISSILYGYGTILLGFVSPFGGKYYWCCRNSVHKTTPMVLGSFIGACLMFANLTFVCAVLFGEFQVRDYNNHEGEEEEKHDQIGNISRSSTTFSILCIFLTILYSGFAALVFTYSNDLIQENLEDERREALRPSEDDSEDGRDHLRGYLGNKFIVQSPSSMQTATDGYISGSFGLQDV